MVDYKGTVAELQEILKSRSLPTSGKKADLIARLQEADKEAESNDAANAPPAPSTNAPPSQQPAPEPITTKPAPEPIPDTSNPPTEPAVAAADSPSANTDSALAASANYALNLPTSSIDDEIAKRKARAERFGTAPAAVEANGDAGAEGDKNDEAQKSLERAKRFGAGETAVGKLDQALPAERERGRKRPAAESGELDDPGLLRKFGGRGGFRGRRRGGGGDGGRGGGGGRAPGQRPAGVQKGGALSEKDRAAAEARKKRFTAA